MHDARDICGRRIRGLVPAVLLSLLAAVSAAGAGSGPRDGNDAVEAGLRALRSGDAPLAISLLRASAPSEEALSGEAHLGLGVAYTRMGRWDSAVRSFRLGRESLGPVLAGWALYQQVLALEAAGRSEEARRLLASDMRALTPPLRDRFLRLRLEWARAAGDVETEAGLLERRLREGRGDRASAAERLGRIHASAPPRARGYLLRALEVPGSDEARSRAARTLLEEGGLTPGQRLLAGEALHAVADWDGAVRAFRPVLEGDVPDALRLEARYRLGLALYRGRHYRQAGQAFSAVAERPGRFRTGAGYYAARAAAASSATPEAVSALTSFADTFPGSRWAPRALRDAAERLYRRDCTQAREVTERLLREYPAHWQNADAIFQMGSCALEGGAREEAQRWFERLGRGVHHPHEKARGWYWAGRTAVARGDSAAAWTFLERAADRYPDTWYGSLAVGELGREEVGAAPDAGWVGQRDLTVPEWADRHGVGASSSHCARESGSGFSCQA
ncbi:MAG: tetratricopeptide repeat protein, partial [bacterium]